MKIPPMVREGVFHPGFTVSSLEARLFKAFRSILTRSYGFKYLSVPTTITRQTIERQGVIPWEWVVRLSDNLGLAGSAEQGILEHFADQRVGKKGEKSLRVFAENQCFRDEGKFEGLKYLLEFKKLELFSFCTAEEADPEFNLLLSVAQIPLDQHKIEYRTVDVTTRDPGYHIKKVDIEVLTKTYGWLETHSCTYFGEEQTRRFGISGLTHTISNTGMASPRILVPLLERKGIKF